MLLVDFTTEVGVNASTDIQRSLTYLANLTYLQKVITEHWPKLTSSLTSTLRIAMSSFVFICRKKW